MAIPLFEHNQKAYEAAAAMLEQSGRAAVIHPTGTGKSFIGFKLAEEHPASRVLWMSPSEYIFHTQEENLRRICPGYSPDNIVFLTYAKLILMDEGQMSAYAPDYVILDEFHRCGAQEWGKNLKLFLDMFPKAKVLGLSATHIRYLDNQRDMAEELFDGNIASHMTLGEAITLGILPCPTYVISVYSYQKEMNRLKERVDALKDGRYKSENKKYLEDLRRTLELSEGLDQIFQKHMPDRSGKYIVFCTDREHMEEMMGFAGKWFGAIDQDMHIYQVYSQDSAAEQTFASFKADDSRHLKLLYCIDMLNEGIHVEGVDGVILFRPTTSPIIYRQQVGRALSASKGGQPVIFDIVNNFDSLYTISSIEEEMDSAVRYYRERGEGRRIVHHRFKIHDEIRESRRVFEELERRLAAPWELCFQEAKAYFQEHGNLEVPKRYCTETGISLGQWLDTQRRVRSGRTAGILTEEQITRLDAIGMVWGSRLELSWERYFQAAQQYYEENGDLDIKTEYITPEGLALGKWIVRLRRSREHGSQRGLLTEERIGRLDAIGMIWDKAGMLWEKGYQEAWKYYGRHGDLEMASSYVTEDGFPLGRWLDGQRRKRRGQTADPEGRRRDSNGQTPGKQNETAADGKLTPQQTARLDKLGMRWESVTDSRWEKSLSRARAYYEKFGDLNMPQTYTSPDGYSLGKWVANQRRRRAQGKLTTAQENYLSELGMEWETADPWQERYMLAKEYREKNGSLDISQNYVTGNGIWLGKWLYQQRRDREKLTREQRRKLEELGMKWSSPYQESWNKKYEDAKRYYETYGNLKIPASYKTPEGAALGQWAVQQRSKRRAGKLSQDKIALLDQIEMVWDPISPCRYRP